MFQRDIWILRGGSIGRNKSGVSAERAGNDKRKRRVEPEGETEMPEVKVVSEGNRKVPEGNARRQEFEEVEEVKSPKTTVIRVESEETQDYLKEARNVSHEEREEISYVPSAISVPQKHLFRCDNHCNEKAFSFWQFASVVKKEGRRSHTRQMYARSATMNLWWEKERNN